MYRMKELVRSTHTQDGGIALDIQRGRIFNLNPAGSTVLDLLKRGATESEIVECICSEFHVDKQIAEFDLREFLTELKGHGLVEEDDFQNEDVECRS